MKSYSDNGKFENQRVKVHNELYEFCLSGACLNKKLNDAAGDTSEYADSFNKNKSRAKWVLNDAIELGMLDDDSFKQVVKTFGLEKYVKSMTMSLSSKEQVMIHDIGELNKKIRSCVHDPDCGPVVEIMKKQIREYTQTALDAGMGDVYFIDKVAAEYGVGQYLKDGNVKLSALP